MSDKHKQAFLEALANHYTDAAISFDSDRGAVLELRGKTRDGGYAFLIFNEDLRLAGLQEQKP